MTFKSSAVLFTLGIQWQLYKLTLSSCNQFPPSGPTTTTAFAGLQVSLSLPAVRTRCSTFQVRWVETVLLVKQTGAVLPDVVRARALIVEAAASGVVVDGLLLEAAAIEVGVVPVAGGEVLRGEDGRGVEGGGEGDGCEEEEVVVDEEAHSGDGIGRLIGIFTKAGFQMNEDSGGRLCYMFWFELILEAPPGKCLMRAVKAKGCRQRLFC